MRFLLRWVRGHLSHLNEAFQALVYEPVSERLGDDGRHLWMRMIGRARALWVKERERSMLEKRADRARRAERERWGFVDCFRVGEKWPFLPFCDEVREVSKNLRAIILAFLGVRACMHVSLNIITFCSFFLLLLLL